MYARITAALIACLALTALAAPAANADRTFSVRYASTQKGSTRLVANTLMTCNGGAHVHQRARRHQRQQQRRLHDGLRRHRRSDAFTSSNSSTADLSLPAGASVSSPASTGARTRARAPAAPPRRTRRSATASTSRRRRVLRAITASVVDTDSHATRLATRPSRT